MIENDKRRIEGKEEISQSSVDSCEKALLPQNPFKNLLSVQLLDYTMDNECITSCKWQTAGVNYSLNCLFTTPEEIEARESKELGLYVTPSQTNRDREMSFTLRLLPQSIQDIAPAVNTISSWAAQNAEFFTTLKEGEEVLISQEDIIAGEKLNRMMIQLLGALFEHELERMSDKWGEDRRLSLHEVSQISCLMMQVMAEFEGKELYNNPAYPVPKLEKKEE